MGLLFLRFAMRSPRVAVAAGALLVSACNPRGDPSGESDSNRDVVVYCSVDREFAEPILAEFEKRTATKVHRVFDTEAGKTTGLVNRLISEKSRPRADVWWSSEIFGTIQLAGQGVLTEYRPASAADIPEQYRDPAGRWTAFGLRGRVLAYDPKRTRREDLPAWWGQVADSKYKGRVCMADPRFGTTRGHMAAMLHVLGADRMKEFYEGLRDNKCRLTDGNAQSVLLLSRGAVDLAATDTDDVIVAQARGDSIEMVYPALATGGGDVGTLWIPCTVALVQSGPNSPQGQRLLDYLVSGEVEEKLALSDSRNVPVRAELREKLRMPAPAAAAVDYNAIAEKLEESDRLIREVLLK